jgi:hypothetical protein
MHGNPDTLNKIPLVGNMLSSINIEHLDHHKEVKMDMTINNLSNHTDHGMYFSWNTIPLITLEILLLLLVFNLFDNVKNNILVALLSGIFYGVIWNTIHPMMHKFNIDITWKDGIPNLKNVKLNNVFYKWLLKNHSLHHYQKDNKGNYNILLPGFDLLANTYYNRCYDNIEYCKKNDDEKTCSNDKLLKRCLTVL